MKVMVEAIWMHVLIIDRLLLSTQTENTLE